ncbi:MAG TPA: DUF4402 domain-containing protein, partial [Sphingomonadaceae bacterium]|nr:DUF4402 domain-containing protein [Sphingomonadaceae bacterium]
MATALVMVTAPSQAAEEAGCKLCEDARQERQLAPLQVQVVSGLEFSKLALLNKGDGEVELDPVTERKITRQNLIDLGGNAFKGRAIITGEPFEPVSIEMPASVMLFSAGGAEAEVTDFVTDLADFPVLDENGKLEFAFGGRLMTR